MDDLRCQCSKIVCQTNENLVIIKCRHCKRYMVIKMGPVDVEVEAGILRPHFLNKNPGVQHVCIKH